MILLNLEISNPFKCKDGAGKNIFVYDRKVTKNKAFEVQLALFPASTIFGITIDTNWKGSDHAGPRLNLSILWVFFSIGLYDIRHWNYSESRWYRDDEDPFVD